MKRAAALLGVLLGLVVLACSACGTPAASTPLSVDVSPSAPPSASASAMGEATRFRQAFGLRADRAWVLSVANDPAAAVGVRTYGVPLLPTEVADLLSRAANDDGVVEVVERYGRAFPADWGGVYVDQQAGGVLVARFSARVDQHRDALLAMLPPGTRIDIRSERWNQRELQEFADWIHREKAWFGQIGTALAWADPMLLENAVELAFEGPDPRAAAAIERHFGNPPWLKVTWSGPLPWRGPTGEVLVIVRDESGNPVSSHSVAYDPIDPMIGQSSAVSGIDRNGEVIQKGLAAVPYRVRLLRHTDMENDVLAEATVTIRADDRTVLRITVPSE